MKTERKIALCYIRVASTSAEDKVHSFEEQRQHILQLCEQNNWIPEWYEDVGGYSGMSEDDRPGFQSLRNRFTDAQVTAVVVDSLERLSRKPAHIYQFLETLEKHHIKLAVANLERMT